MAWQWLANDSDAKAKVSELLGQHQFDETAIEAEAFRMRVEDLEKLDYMLSRAELRREKLLTGIAAFRQGRRGRRRGWAAVKCLFTNEFFWLLQSDHIQSLKIEIG